MSRKSVFCTVRTRHQAEQIVQRLQAAGFATNEISLLLPDQHVAKSGARGKPAKAAAGDGSAPTSRLVGVRKLNVPDFGPCLAAGPVATALSAAAVGASTTGIAEVLAGMGLAGFEAQRYEDKVGEGNIFIAAHADDAVEAAGVVHIFDSEEAEHLSTAVESVTERKAGHSEDHSQYDHQPK
jgi:hypothetical protein